MTRRRLVTLVAALLLLAPRLGHAAAPDWLLAAAAQRTADARTGATVLLDEIQATVGADGRVTTRRRYAVRIHSRDGLAAATMRDAYTTDSATVRSVRGWLIVDGRAVDLGRENIADVALVDNDVYNEARARVITAGTAAVSGSVFGAESEIVERSVFTQFEWVLQDDWPALTVSRALTLPPGWDLQWLTFNHEALTPERAGTTATWTLHATGGIASGAAVSPGAAPRLAVSYFPAGQPAFPDWTAVSRWLAGLPRADGDRDSALTMRARALTAAATADVDRVAAIAAYVQRVQYISVQTGLGRGGGYTPHPAADVLARNYGDCKDKANLMRALLGAVGIRAFLVTIYAGDPTYVRAEWPSPQQFNHAIVAVALDGGADSVAVTDATAGRLLFFDPTDPYTPFGHLPLPLQGSLGLIVSADKGALLRLPLTAPETHARRREVTATISVDGDLRATIAHVALGDAASSERARRDRGADGYVRGLELELRRQVAGSSLALRQFDDSLTRNQVALTVDVTAEGYGQKVAGGLLIVRPLPMLRLALPAADGRSDNGLALEQQAEEDHLTVIVPEGSKADDIPAPVERAAGFGRFSVRWALEGNRLTRTVALRLERTRLTPDTGPAVRAFIEQFRAAERLPVVLAR